MSYTYVLHPNTKQEVSEGFAWYENKLAGLGYEFLNAVEKKIAEIISHPETFSSKGNSSYREAMLNRFPFVIVYRIYKQKKQVFISSVHHTKKSVRRKYRRP